jgi:hypothetical protein
MTAKRLARSSTFSFGFAEGQQRDDEVSEWAVGVGQAVGWGANEGHVTSWVSELASGASWQASSFTSMIKVP